MPSSDDAADRSTTQSTDVDAEHNPFLPVVSEDGQRHSSGDGTDTETGTGRPLVHAEYLDRITDGLFILDEDWRILYMNARAHEVINPDNEDVIGEVFWDVYERSKDMIFGRKYIHTMETQEPTHFTGFYPPLDTHVEVRAFPSESGITVYFEDITEETRREQHLERSAEAKHRLHEVSVSDAPLDEKLGDVLEIGADYFNLEYGFLADVDATDDPDCDCTFDVVSAYGFDADDGWEYPLDETYCQAVIEQGDILHTTDAQEAAWVSEEVYEHFQFDTYVGATVNVNGEPFGVVGFVASEPRPHQFSPPEAAFIELVSQWIGYELSQSRQQEQVETINECYEIVRDIAHTIIDATDRGHVERAACDRLVSNDLDITMAWVGDVRYKNNEIVESYAAGDAEGYLADVTIPLNQEDHAEGGPSVRAVRTKTPQPVSDIRTDASIQPWRESMLERDYLSAIAVPLVHNDLVYGVLALYSEETGAFDGEVCEIFGHLGQLVGHTIHSIEQDKALREDDTVYELEYVNHEFAEAMAGIAPDSDAELTVEMERTVKHNGGYRAFIRSHDLPPNAFIAAFEQLATVESVSLVDPNHDDPDERCDNCLYLVELHSDAVVSQVEQFGGKVSHLTIANDGLRLVVEVPPTTDIKEFSARVQGIYPDTELVRKHAVERERATIEEIDQIIDSELTARQQDVLQSAHMAGYFEMPRKNTGGDVAEMLDISGATFSEHLRTAQNKLFSAIF